MFRYTTGKRSQQNNRKAWLGMTKSFLAMLALRGRNELQFHLGNYVVNILPKANRKRSSKNRDSQIFFSEGALLMMYLNHPSLAPNV